MKSNHNWSQFYINITWCKVDDGILHPLKSFGLRRCHFCKDCLRWHHVEILFWVVMSFEKNWLVTTRRFNQYALIVLQKNKYLNINFPTEFLTWIVEFHVGRNMNNLNYFWSNLRLVIIHISWFLKHDGCIYIDQKCTYAICVCLSHSGSRIRIVWYCAVRKQTETFWDKIHVVAQPLDNALLYTAVYQTMAETVSVVEFIR